MSTARTHARKYIHNARIRANATQAHWHLPTDAHAHTGMHADMHIHFMASPTIRAYTHGVTKTDTQIHTCIHACGRAHEGGACMDACLQVCAVCVCAVDSICKCVHAQMRGTCAHTCIHAFMHTCVHAYMRSCIHAYMHTYIHAYMRADKRMRAELAWMLACRYALFVYAQLIVFVNACTIARMRAHAWTRMRGTCAHACICVSALMQSHPHRKSALA
jgi:hypothetical protein